MAFFSRLIAALAPACLACLTSAARAQTAPPAPNSTPAVAPEAVPVVAPAAPQPAPQAVQSAAALTGAGPYVVAALGRADYSYACYFIVACEDGRANSGKLGFGYRTGTFAVEGWWSDFGRAHTSNGDGTVQLRALGVSARWSLRFADVFEGLIRAGLADVRYTHAGNSGTRSESHFQPTFGLGLAVAVTPVVAVELAWDLTRGDAANESTTFVSAVSLGLRFRF